MKKLEYSNLLGFSTKLMVFFNDVDIVVCLHDCNYILLFMFIYFKINIVLNHIFDSKLHIIFHIHPKVCIVLYKQYLLLN